MRKYLPADICPNKRRYRIVSNTLVSAYRNREGVFSDPSASWPENRIYQSSVVSRASDVIKINATFFAGLFLRGKITTERAIRSYLGIIESCPWAIESSTIRTGNSRRIRLLNEALDNAGLGHVVDQVREYWWHNANIMFNLGGTLSPQLSAVTSFDEALYVFGTPKSAGAKNRFPNLQNLGFLGYGGTGKVMALILQMLMEQDLMAKFSLPVSADFHLLSIYLRSGAIVPPAEVRTHYTLARLIRDLSLEMMPKNDIEYNNIISRATYQLGATVCPANPDEKTGSKHPSCVGCPIAKYCDQNVPKSNYHQKGYLEVIEV